MIRVPKTSQGSQGIFQGEGNQKKEVYFRLIEQEMQILCNKMQHTGFSELREGWSSGVQARGRRVGHGGVKRAQEGLEGVYHITEVWLHSGNYRKPSRALGKEVQPGSHFQNIQGCRVENGLEEASCEKKKKGVCVHCVSKNGDLDVGDAGIDKIRKWG